MDAYASCVAYSEHGVDRCVEAGPCGIEKHYVLKGTTVDKDGQDHAACPGCGGWLCQGEHGVGVCCDKAPCGIAGHTVLPGSTKDINGVDHSNCEHCYRCLCQGEHGLDLCYDVAPCGIPGHFVLMGEVIGTDGVNHSRCEFCNRFMCWSEHGIGLCISDDATLKTLTVTYNGQTLTLDPVFDGQNVFMYFAGANRVVYAGQTATVTAEANNPAARVTGAGTFTVTAGGNAITVVVTAEYTKVKQEYTVSLIGTVWQYDDPVHDPDTPPG